MSQAMRRRLLGAGMVAFAAGPLRAQERKRRLAILTVIPQAEAKPYLDALLEGLKARGWVEGRNLIVDVRYTQGVPSQYPAATAELLALKPDVFLAATDEAAKPAAASASPPPIVFALANDPVGSGLVQSLARPGIAATGFSNMTFELSGKRLSLLKEAVPALSTVGVLEYVGGQPGTQLAISQYEEAGRWLKVAIIRHRVETPEDLDRAFESLARRGAQGFVTVGNPWFIQGQRRQQLHALAMKYRFATCAPGSVYADAGLLMSYSVDYVALFARSAALVDRIFKGADASTMPVEQPNVFELVLNLRTARALGLAMPSTVLLQATRLIE